jgi:hypothetical protein
VHTATAALPSPHVICAKFRTEAPPSIPEPQPLSSPLTDQWNDPWSGATIPRETEGFLWGRRESKEDIKQQRRNTAEGAQQLKLHKKDSFEGRTPDAKGDSLRHDINIGDGTQGTWLVLDTLDEHGTWSRPPAGSCLTVSSFLSSLEPSTCLTPMFTGHDQLYVGSKVLPSRLLLLFPILPILPASFFN